ncbi:aspartate kinase [Peptoniphilus asaccharolyticus DSM 20463]|uniref:Aspartokinase n=1 Tax=Peptoniphilus asaccharolyticus DSM 20463 TaxID=573058 RepID=A0A1W1VGK8_PEPAS|nr:aspartate kinase [Peptoniphilus asaccharolyticus]MBL7575882.1 aspartate kinase [Peptoniphilus asaccharolyticus]SMB92084.1 aspartate kinase [Peptoniphilus asaccharolyticus DSM 20463]
MIKVSKFGGSSLASGDRFLEVREILKSDLTRRYIVASAPGKVNSSDTKVTDLLYLAYDLSVNNINSDDILNKVLKKYQDIIEKVNVEIDLDSEFEEFTKNMANESKDYIASRGEYLNAKILAKLLGYDFVDAKELIFFDKNGNIDETKTYNAIAKMREEHEYAVIPGFYGVNINGKVKTFSRGGGDLTGSIIARGVEADLYENWTDVSGFLAVDPKIVQNPREVRELTYRELRELSYAGASVLHAEAILPVQSAGIPIQIKNTFVPEDDGTMIVPDERTKSDIEITGVTGKKEFAVINIEKIKMNSDKGFHRKVMSVLEVNDVTLEHMPSSIDSLSLIVPSSQIIGKTDTIISELKTFCNPNKVSISYGIALITVVGRGMQDRVGTSAKIFSALATENINIKMIIQGSSELNIIVGILEQDYDKAIEAIYKSFVKGV